MATAVLVGGNEFRADCESMDRLILGRIADPRPKVVIVPTAAAFQNPSLAARNGTRYFAGLGADARAVMIVSRADANNPRLVDELAWAQLIYLTGGDPGHLHQTLKGSLAWQSIVQLNRSGVVVVGSSAGAMVMAERVRGAGGSWAPALGLAPGVAVLPHFRMASGGTARPSRAGLDDGVALLGIGEATGCLTDGAGEWQVVGSGAMLVDAAGASRVHRAGSTFRLPVGRGDGVENPRD